MKNKNSLHKLPLPSKGMSKQTLRKVHPLLEIFSKLSGSEKKVLLHFLTHEGCEGIYECINNALENDSLGDTEKRFLLQSLSPQKKKLRRLQNLTDPAKKKKSLLQVGEGVGVIVDTVVPLIRDYLNPV